MADREYSARLLRVRARKKAIAPRWPGYLPNSALILHHSLSQGTRRRIPETRNLSSLTDGGAFPSATRIATSSIASQTSTCDSFLFGFCHKRLILILD
jgi:hypothetical protein